ncbi:PLAC8-like protein 1 isoform X3 [Platichthys flesus]|uniref:PLAC8-like protein 1 isoform X3 n=1 Tax=Platichthys flesus TaxID=8260 RepID=UPI002DBE1930|nr:PLAC8-like protein 1 isoform X3 [Platichthys flesus]
MEQTTVTHQPGLSLTTHSPSAFGGEDAGGGLATGSEAHRRSMDAPAATDPILTQPGLGVTTTTITTITQTGGDWSSGLFDICGDKTSCVLGALVPCCLDLSLAHQYGECLCTPLLPGSTFAMRVGIRERYKIRVSVCVCVCICVCMQIIHLSMGSKERSPKTPTEISHNVVPAHKTITIHLFK